MGDLIRRYWKTDAHRRGYGRGLGPRDRRSALPSRSPSSSEPTKLGANVSQQNDDLVKRAERRACFRRHDFGGRLLRDGCWRPTRGNERALVVVRDGHRRRRRIGRRRHARGGPGRSIGRPAKQRAASSGGSAATDAAFLEARSTSSRWCRRSSSATTWARPPADADERRRFGRAPGGPAPRLPHRLGCARQGLGKGRHVLHQEDEHGAVSEVRGQTD